jgi:GH25 family lysozyme M1 (1,4-beta-N-acetylmuramidase)
MSVGSVTARIARRICDQEDVGYSQPDRRTWYANANWEGHCSSPQNADCSSLAAGAVCYGLHDTYGVTWGHPALPEINDHWTGNLRPGLEARGFNEVPWNDSDLAPQGGFRVGDVILSAANEGGRGHVCIAVEDGGDPLVSEAWIAEDGSIDGYLGDQTGGETRTVRYSSHPHTQSGAWTSCHRFDEGKFLSQWPEFRKGQTAQAKPAVASTSAPSAPAHAHGIDISSHQGGLNISAIWADFVIVKITEGTGYVNPFWQQQAEATLAAGKRLGLYLFANDEDAGEQARFFLDRAKGYAGRATFWLDWENEALNLDPSDALVILNQMAAETRSTPGVYLNGAGMGSGDWSAVATRFPLWYAGGPNYASYGQAYSDPPTPTVPYWGGNVLIHQYTEDGYLPGYSKRLDLDRLRDRAAWDRMIGGGQVISGAPAPVSTSSALQVDGEYGPATMKRLIDVFAPGYNEMFAVGNLRRYLNSTVASNAQRMLIGADKLPEDRGWDSHVIRIFQYWAWCCVRPVAPEMWARFADGWSFGEYVDGEPGEATWAALQEALNRSRPGSFRLM